MEEKEEAVLSFKDILGVLRKNLIFIIITCLVFSLGSFFVTNFLVTKHYTSTISLYVETVDLQPDSQNSVFIEYADLCAASGFNIYQNA